MTKILDHFFSIIPSLLVSLVVLLFLDFFFGKQFVTYLDGNSEREFRIIHPVYSHTLKPNYRGIANWGERVYEICTNSYGFKTSCDNLQDNKNDVHDFVFIGDSFTEAIGIPYHKSFVGLVQEKLPTLKITNMGVASYSPSIYFSKIRHYIQNGMKIKNVVVFIDPGDIFDESNRRIFDGIVINDHDSFNNSKKIKLLKVFISDKFSATYYFFHQIRKLLNSVNNKDKKGNFGSNDQFAGIKWVSKDYAKGFEEKEVNIAINKSLETMRKLYEYLTSRNISLSVAVYPWHYQLENDKKNSEHVKIWRKYCEGKCLMFINSHATFYELKNYLEIKELNKKFYIKGDTHFNEEGNEILANDFLLNFRELEIYN